VPGDGGLLETVRRARRELARLGSDHLQGDFARISLPDADCDALCDLFVAERPRVLVEIGLGYGSSALAIAEALLCAGQPDSQHLIIDPYQDSFEDAGWKSIVSAGLSNLSVLLTERSQLALPRLVTGGVVADAAFVDGSHAFHNVFVDLFFLRELVRPGGLIVLDDCQWPSVATAARYFEVNAGWQQRPVGRTRRLRAFRLPDPVEERPFESFKPF
jgi:predicted O-methyltransferase YrrM